MGQLAAVASRVGLDEFDPAKLQQGSADLPWLSKVAVRHNQIIAALAMRRAVLPMRLGTMFQSRDSLLARLKPYEPQAADFLRGTGRPPGMGREIVHRERAERCRGATTMLRVVPGWSGSEAALLDKPAVAPAGGTQYLAAQGLRLRRRRQVDTAANTAAATIEDRLGAVADSWRRLRPLPHVFTNRPEKMAWNAAFLLSRLQLGAFQAACGATPPRVGPRRADGRGHGAVAPLPFLSFLRAPR